MASWSIPENRNCLRDLQEAPSKSGGESDETTRGWARGKRGWEQRGETKGVGSAAPS